MHLQSWFTGAHTAGGGWVIGGDFVIGIDDFWFEFDRLDDNASGAMLLIALCCAYAFA